MSQMFSTAALQASTKAPSHKPSCRTQPNPPKTEKSRLDPTRPNPWVNATHWQLCVSSRRGEAGQTANCCVRIVYFNLFMCVCVFDSSALTLLVGQQEGHPACKKLGAGMVISLERCADLHTAQLMPLPLTVSCFSKIQIGFTYLIPAHPELVPEEGR